MTLRSSRQLGRRSFLRTAGVVAGGAVLAGCAPTTPPASSSAPAKPAAAATAAPAAAKPASTAALKIGVLLPYSGVYTVLGESITNGMQMYFDSVNNSAGGRTVTLIKED